MSPITPISPSALGVAHLRHLEETLSKDVLAKHFTNDDARRVAEGWLKDYPQVARQVALRGRYIEDVTARAIEVRGFSQIVNVAAGLNTFPYRYDPASQLKRYAELDQSSMLDFKKKAISDLVSQGIIKSPAFDIVYVPTNLCNDRISSLLDSTGWDWSLPTVFIIEGISYYLPLHTLAQVIDDIKTKSRGGSVVIMDYFPARVQTTPVFKKVMGGIAKNGEPCHTCPTPEDIQSLFKGYKIISGRALPDIEKEYCADTTILDFDAIIVAETNLKT